jgi:hypothetical protein
MVEEGAGTRGTRTVVKGVGWVASAAALRRREQVAQYGAVMGAAQCCRALCARDGPHT